MPSTARIFVALPIPDVQKTRLGRLQGLIAPDLPGASWVTPDHFHITLTFLGDVPDVDLAGVCRKIAEAASGTPKFTLNLQSLGAFGEPTRPRVAWVGVTGPGIDTLRALRQSIAEAAADAGYPPDSERFDPHLTLGRLRSKKGEEVDMPKLIAHFRTWSAGNFEVGSVLTMASTIAPEGPTYMTMATAQLKTPKRGMVT